jgi:prepilin-type N-terminal cleavage/methylation domain-containing protein
MTKLVYQRAIAPKPRGFTLTELAIVLGVIGTILGAIWVASANVTAGNKAQKAQGEVQQILAGYRSMFAQRAVDGVNGADITQLGINSNYFPSDMISAATVLNPWGTTVTVRGDSGWNGIIISFWNLPQNACSRLANSLASSPDILQSWVGSVPVNVVYPPHGVGANGVAGPINMTTAQIDAACTAGTNQVSFDYKAR